MSALSTDMICGRLSSCSGVDSNSGHRRNRDYAICASFSEGFDVWWS